MGSSLHMRVQKFTRTTWPRNSAGPSGSELSHWVAPTQRGYVQTFDHGHLPKRPEGRPDFLGEQLGLLPGGEVAAPVDLVEVGDSGENHLDPAARGSPELAGKRREADRNRDRRRSLAGRTGCGLGPSTLPEPPGGRGAGARQPVQRDVVDDVVPGEVAHGLAVDERAGDLVVAVRVVVEQPGGQGDG